MYDVRVLVPVVDTDPHLSNSVSTIPASDPTRNDIEAYLSESTQAC